MNEGKKVKAVRFVCGYGNIETCKRSNKRASIGSDYPITSSTKLNARNTISIKALSLSTRCVSAFLFPFTAFFRLFFLPVFITHSFLFYCFVGATRLKTSFEHPHWLISTGIWCTSLINARWSLL